MKIKLNWKLLAQTSTILIAAGVILLSLTSTWDRLIALMRANLLLSWLVIALLAIPFVVLGPALRTKGSKWWQEFRDARVVISSLVVVIGVGFLLVGAATQLSTETLKGAALRIAALWSLAWLLSGFFVGFLFGIPRVLQAGGPSANTTGAVPANRLEYVQMVNTNLEQISDWLTKIIVGVGLVQLKDLPRLLRLASEWVAGSLSVGPPAQASISFASSMILYFSIVGFLTGYLTTRLFLAGAFGRADRSVEGQSSFREDDIGERIRKFWKPTGNADPAHERQLSDWMKANGLGDKLITELMSAAELQSARQKAVADLKIP
jgi:hypothetical protein